MMPAYVAIPALALAALCSAAAMWAGVKDESYATVAWSAAAFATFAIAVSWVLNRSQWLSARADGEAWRQQLSALRRNGQLSAVVYAWGAVALFAMYALTGLYWQHGLQYAGGMALFSALIYAWSHLARPDAALATPQWTKRAARLNLVHGGAAAIATVVFLVSGKLWVPRPDWAANIVFVAGGVLITSFCALAAFTHACILGNSDAPEPSS